MDRLDDLLELVKESTGLAKKRETKKNVIGIILLIVAIVAAVAGAAYALYRFMAPKYMDDYDDFDDDDDFDDFFEDEFDDDITIPTSAPAKDVKEAAEDLIKEE